MADPPGMGSLRLAGAVVPHRLRSNFQVFTRVTSCVGLTKRSAISSQIIVRNNTLRRNLSSGIFISTSKNVEAYNNTLEDNWRAIQYFLNCDALGGGSTGYDLTNKLVHDNVIKVGTLSGSFGNSITYVSTCSATQVAPYLNGQKNLRFVANRYFVPSTTTRYFVWGLNTFKSWSEWQALGNDATGTYQLR